MSNIIRTASLCLLLTLRLSAQQFHDVISYPDSTYKDAIKECLRTLNYFTGHGPDTLYSVLGKDPAIVPLDTLKKYSALHKDKYDYPKSETKNPVKWELSATSFQVRRVYVGQGKLGAHEWENDDALVLTATMKFENGKVTFTKISFAITPISAETKDVLLSKRAKYDEKLIMENLPDPPKPQHPTPPAPQPQIKPPPPPKFDPPPTYNQPRYSPPVPKK